MTAVLDAGALIAVDKRDRSVGAMLRVLQRDGVPVVTSPLSSPKRGATRGARSTSPARSPGVTIAALDDVAAKKVGELLRANGTSDLADAHLALLVQPQDRVLTSDQDDIKALLRTRRVKAVTVHV